MQENIKLKTQLNRMETEKLNHKREITNLENKLSQKDKIIENMINESQASTTPSKASEMHLVINVKRQYKELKKDYEKNNQELSQTKKNIKYTKILELMTENRIFANQIDKLKNLLNLSKEQKQSLKKNINNFGVMKQALSNQDYIILGFQENCQKMEAEIQLLNTEIEKLKKQNNSKEEMITKIKTKLQTQQSENEKLILTHNNIQKSDAYIKLKNKYESKIQQLKKDIAFYRNSNAKNEKILREADKIKKTAKFNSTKVSRKIYCTNPQPSLDIEPYPQTESNQKLLLIQSIYSEEKNEREKLQQKVDELTQQLEHSKTFEPKIVLANSYSANNIKSSLKVFDYEYLSEVNLNEFIYVLLKNLEAKKIDVSILESRVINIDALDLLKEKNNHKVFVMQVGNNLCEILKVKQQKDQIDIYSFINTFFYNNYMISEKQDSEEFKNKFLSLFSKISFYSLEQRQELNKIISYQLTKKKDEFLKLVHYFDQTEKGFICFNSLKKILENLNLKFKSDVKEYFIYVMKCFHDDNNFLKDLKYENILKILEETPIDPNENLEDLENDEENKEKPNDDDDAIEITNEEYLSKVKDIISRICKVLVANKKKVDDYFLKIVSESITEYKGIRLIKLVEVLKEEFHIELSNVEIFCLFTKVKPTLEASKDPDDIEEIIDYNKFKNEIEDYLRHPPKDNDNKEKSSSGKKKTKDFKNKSDNIKEKNLMESFNENKSDLRNILMNFMKKHKFTFERFIFPVHCMMKLTTDNKKYNRYLDVEFFKHFLYQNGILIQSSNIMEFIGNNKLLYNNEKINIDYLKYLINEDGNNNNKYKESDYMMYKPINDRPKISN